MAPVPYVPPTLVTLGLLHPAVGKWDRTRHVHRVPEGVEAWPREEVQAVGRLQGGPCGAPAPGEAGEAARPCPEQQGEGEEGPA